ncbi:MAG: hypothetical protein P8L26_03120 [Alphaproteobacteria bacterium]|nr:hypothetical protein [Alphaproteobacteria bacterium]
MRIIKVLCFLFLLSSCDKYLGVVEPDYNPTDELKDIFTNNLNKSNQTEISEIKKIIYPSDNFFVSDINSIEIKKIVSLEESSSIYFEKDNVYFTKKDKLIIFNLAESKEIFQINLNLDKDEKIIKIFEYSNKKFILSNKSRLFLLNDDEINLIANFDQFITDKTIHHDEKLLIFSVFGDLFEINLIEYSSNFKGNFPVKHGVNISSKNYKYKNQISHLFNSGTLIFLSLKNYNLDVNYYFEDLDILSSLRRFEEFVDAPFSHNDYLYFIDKSGLISVFNPMKSEFLWEVDINSNIKDFNFSNDGNLLLLTNDNVLILDNLGNLITTLGHSNETPLKLVSEKDKIMIINKKGIDVLDLNSESRVNFFKNKFEGAVEYILFNSNSYVKDNKNLYKLSE